MFSCIKDVKITEIYSRKMDFCLIISTQSNSIERNLFRQILIADRIGTLGCATGRLGQHQEVQDGIHQGADCQA